MLLDKDRIKESLTVEDINMILRELGSKDPIMGNQFQTVCHGGHKHKLYYYDNSKEFHCYTDCSENMDIYEVVVRARKQQGQTISFPQAVRYVANLTGRSFSKAFPTFQSDLIDDWDWINKLKKKDKKIIELPEYDHKVMDLFMPYPHQSWLEEGISAETISKFNIGYYFRTHDEGITIPHYDINDRLVGIRRRSMIEEDINNGRKYMPISVGNKFYNHQTMFNCYGLNHTKKAVSKLKKCGIFEGEKSVLKCEDMYGDLNFTVATGGSSISNWQRDIILSLGVEEVIIMQDKYAEGSTEKEIEDYQKKLLKLAKKFVPFVRTYIVWDDFDLLDYSMSPVDRGKEVLEQLMKTKYEIKTCGVEE